MFNLDLHLQFKHFMYRNWFQEKRSSEGLFIVSKNDTNALSISISNFFLTLTKTLLNLLVISGTSIFILILK